MLSYSREATDIRQIGNVSKRMERRESKPFWSMMDGSAMHPRWVWLKRQRLHVLNCVKWEYISSWFLLVLSNIINDSTFVTDTHHPVIRLPLFHQSLCMKSDWQILIHSTIDQSASAWCLGSAQWLMWPLRILFATHRLCLITLSSVREQRAESWRILVLDTRR